VHLEKSDERAVSLRVSQDTRKQRHFSTTSFCLLKVTGSIENQQSRKKS